MKFHHQVVEEKERIYSVKDSETSPRRFTFSVLAIRNLLGLGLSHLK